MDKSAFGQGGARPAPSATPPAPTTIDVLRKIEWAADVDGWAGCPICEGRQSHGHTPDCDLAAVLRANPILAPATPAR